MQFVEPLESRRLLATAVLDPTFGAGGRAIMPFVDGQLLGLQPDGKILVSRYIDGTGSTQLVRLNANGTPDPSFLGGQVDDFPKSADFRINPADGRIAYVTTGANGQAQTKICVLRADGLRDTSFSGDGVLDLGDANQHINDFEWQGGKLLYMQNDIKRLNVDGSLDGTFGQNGSAPFTSVWSDMHIDGAGRIYLQNDIYEEPEFSWQGFATTAEVTRLTANGALDTSYGTNGKAVAATAGGEMIKHQTWLFRVMPDGSAYHLITTGLGSEDGDGRVIFSRLSPQGQISGRQEYVSVGRLNTSPNYLPLLNALSVHVQPDGSVVLSGAPNNTAVGWQVMRLNEDLTIDRTYGTNGLATLGLALGVQRPLTQPDGKLLFGAKRIGLPDATFEVARYETQAQAPAPPVITLNKKGTLVVTTSDDAEHAQLYFRRRDGRLVARVGEHFQSFTPSRVKRIAFFLRGGADTFTIGDGVRGAYCDGGDGNDTLHGGQGGDVLLGDTGKDRILGYDGDDTLLGGGADDSLWGGAGKDDLFGNGGADTLNGAGGNDRLFGGPDMADRILGGAGTDSAAKDDKDSYESIETLLT